MKVWIVLAKIPEIEARSIDRVFDSKEKANKNLQVHILQQEISSDFFHADLLMRSSLRNIYGGQDVELSGDNSVALNAVLK